MYINCNGYVANMIQIKCGHIHMYTAHGLLIDNSCIGLFYAAVRNTDIEYDVISKNGYPW